MHQLVEAAVALKVAVGAHPSFEDRQHFGRKEQQLSPERIYDIVLYQLGALHAFLKTYHTRMHHVKPHGALYNIASREAQVADAIASAVWDFDPSLILYGLSGSELLRAAEVKGLKSASEVFADRTYQSDGSLTPRNAANAFIQDEHDAGMQVLHMIQNGNVKTIDGNETAVKAETICIHGDGSNPLHFAQTIHNILGQHHVRITQP
jgi:UPF0271 protein